MNKLIKQLAEKAGDDWDSTLQSDKEFLEKFAELIVRECANICDQIDTEYGGEDVLASWCSSAILKKFGYD